MKRSLSVLLAILMLASSGLLTGCAAIKDLIPGAGPKGPFTTDFEIDESNIDSFLFNDTIETAVTGGPFYAGAQPLPSQNTQEYDEARAAKLVEIKAEAEALVAAADAAKPAMAALRSEYTAFLEAVYKKEDGLKDIAIETLQTVVLLGTKGVLAEEQYHAIASQETTQAYATAMRDQLAVTKAVELGGLYLEDANTVMGYAAVMVDGLSESTNAEVKAATADFDSKMEGLAADVIAALEPIVQHSANIQLGLNQVSSADYYFAIESMGWMMAEMEELAPLVEGLEPRGEELTAENVEQIKAFYAAFEEWNDSVLQHMASLDTSGMVEVASVPFPDFSLGIEAAYAADGGYQPGANYNAGNQVLNQPAQAPAPQQGWLASGWSAVKTGFGKAKTVVGVGVDAIGLGVRNITSVGAGIYYGNSTKDIVENIMANTKEMVDNYEKGVSGASTFTTANDYIEGVETGAGEAAGGAAEWGIEAILGKGKVSETAGWAVGGITKISVGMFTGMAKGIYKVANKNSSSADVALGFVEIGLGAIGGSKVIIKGSQLPNLLKGGAEGVKAFSNIATQLVAGAANSAQRAQIKKELAALLVKKGFSPDNAVRLIANSIKLEINASVGRLIAASRDLMVKRLRDLISKGGSAFLTNFKDTVKSSLQDLLKKGFAKSFQGVIDAGTTVMGETVKDYIDNLIAAGITDALLTGLITDALAIPPDPGQVAGKWNGSIVITDVDIPESEQKTAEDAQCAQMFKQLEGKSNPMTLDIQMDASGSGTVTMSGGSGGGSGSATYSDGAINMTITADGTTYTLSGTVSFVKEGGMSMSGTWTAPFQGSQIMMSGTFSATK